MISFEERLRRVSTVEEQLRTIHSCAVCLKVKSNIGYQVKNGLWTERQAPFTSIHRLFGPKLELCFACTLQKFAQMAKEQLEPEETRGMARCSKLQLAKIAIARPSYAVFFEPTLIRLVGRLNNKSTISRWICKPIREMIETCVENDKQNTDYKKFDTENRQFWQGVSGFEVDIFKELFELIMNSPTLEYTDIPTFLRNSRQHTGNMPQAAMLAEQVRRKYFKHLYVSTP